MNLLPFTVDKTRGRFYENFTLQFKKAVLTGRLRPGQRVPAISALARQFCVNPNTAARCMQCLSEERIVASRGSMGTYVEPLPKRNRKGKAVPLDPLLEQLLVEAGAFGLTCTDLLKLLQKKADEMKFVPLPS